MAKPKRITKDSAHGKALARKVMAEAMEIVRNTNYDAREAGGVLFSIYLQIDALAKKYDLAPAPTRAAKKRK